MRQVVISGIGIVSPIGVGKSEFKDHLFRGVSGEGPIRSFDWPDFPVKRAFEVKDFDSHKYGTHLLDPFIQYAVAAAEEALEDADFSVQDVDPYRVGASIGSSRGGAHTIDRFKDRLQRKPSAILGARVYSSSIPNFAAQWVARRLMFKGAAKCYIAACATGTTSVIEGARMVAHGMLDYCIAGASDAAVVPLMLAGYRNMGVMTPDHMRPFDRDRNGFLLGEGSGIVFLESEESAKARGAKIYGKILGFEYGFNSSHPIIFSEEEAALAGTLVKLFRKAGITPKDIDYINLHGTATQIGDIYETRQMKKALGPEAYRIPMSSVKSMTGHMLGASGTVEIIASLLAMREGLLPPTLGLTHPDPDCDLDYIAGKARRAEAKTVLSHSMGFGGQIASILLGTA